MNIRELSDKKIVLFDGALGTCLQECGLMPGELPERWNLTHRKEIVSLHMSYLAAGCDVITANTFGANLLKFAPDELDEIIRAAIGNAKEAIRAAGMQDKYVALDIGPTGKLLEPYGDLAFEDAIAIFKRTATLGEAYGADLVIIETMNDLAETRAAVIAVKEATSLPIFVSNAYSSNGKLMTGASPAEMVTCMEGLGVAAIGANCSFGPQELHGIMTEILAHASIPTLFMPNAGLPKLVDGKTVFDVTPDAFADEVAALVRAGVRIVGGCCGTTPSHIKAVADCVRTMEPVPVTPRTTCPVSSGVKTVYIGDTSVIIGERINPTGKRRFKQALIEKDIAYILQEGINQQERGAHILDVNVGIPDIDEPTLLPAVIRELQAVVDTPLQIDTSDPVAMEQALRAYNGHALINSVNGKNESMDAVFPLVKKYGGIVVCLTLDENGIPATAEGRYEIAARILHRATACGIPAHHLIFDTLCMTISTDKHAAETTVHALKLIKERLGARTVLGISNVSYGLPDRESVNATFLTYALQSGLSAAIINPHSEPVMDAFYHFAGEECREGLADFAERVINASISNGEDLGGGIQNYILHGQKAAAARAVSDLLVHMEPLAIVNGEIIPALDAVGKLYEAGKVYLPQLLMSAEAAKASFEVIKEAMLASSEQRASRGKFVIATVHGDIHDIGKNIVKLLLENYGFEVIDLGRDVPEDVVVDAVLKEEAQICGLSALMTTTVPAMERTIQCLRKAAPHCRIVVGGAVLNRDYAEKMGADKYAPDALSTVRYAEEILN